MKHTDAYFRHILNRLPSIKPDEMLLWDDDMKNIEKAKEMGLHAEFYTSFEDFQMKMKQYL